MGRKRRLQLSRSPWLFWTKSEWISFERCLGARDGTATLRNVYPRREESSSASLLSIAGKFQETVRGPWLLAGSIVTASRRIVHHAVPRPYDRKLVLVRTVLPLPPFNGKSSGKKCLGSTQRGARGRLGHGQHLPFCCPNKEQCLRHWEYQSLDVNVL